MKNRQKLEDIALILPIVGFILFLPSVLGIYAKLGSLYSMPILPIYLFVLWLILIVAGYALTSQLSKLEDAPTRLEKPGHANRDATDETNPHPGKLAENAPEDQEGQ